MKIQEPDREEGGGKKVKPKGVQLIHELYEMLKKKARPPISSLEILSELAEWLRYATTSVYTS